MNIFLFTSEIIHIGWLHIVSVVAYTSLGILFFFYETFVYWYTWLSWAFVCLDCKDRCIWVNVLWISWVWSQPGLHTENLSWKRRGMGWGLLFGGVIVVVVRLACKIMFHLVSSYILASHSLPSSLPSPLSPTHP